MKSFIIIAYKQIEFHWKEHTILSYPVMTTIISIEQMEFDCAAHSKGIL